MFGGWPLVAWAMTEVKSQLLHLITAYPIYIVVYVIVVGVTSFLFCHWRGPITHVRTFQVIQWSIQLVAMTLIYHATNFREASLILLVIIILFYLISNKLTEHWGKLWTGEMYTIMAKPQSPNK